MRVGRCMWMPKYLPEITFSADQFHELTNDFKEVICKGSYFVKELDTLLMLFKCFIGFQKTNLT